MLQKDKKKNKKRPEVKMGPFAGSYKAILTMKHLSQCPEEDRIMVTIIPLTLSQLWNHRSICRLTGPGACVVSWVLLIAVATITMARS